MKAIIIFLFLISKAQAAIHLSWEECIQEIGQNNPDLRSAMNSLEASHYQLHGNYSGYLPQISGTISSSRGGASGSTPRNPSSSFSATFSATQNLFTGLQTKAAIDQAKATERVSQANLQTVKATVSYSFKTAYMGLIYAQSYLKLTEDIIHRREENLRIVELRFKNGKENKGDLLLSEAYLKEARFNRLVAQDSMELARFQLAQVLGREDSSELQIDDNIPVTNPDSHFDLKQLAVQTADHRQAAAQEDSADAAVTVARGAFFPALNATGSVGPTGPTFLPSNNGGNTNVWSVGLSLTYAFFNGGKDYYSTKASVQTWKAAAATRESVDRGLLTKLKQAFHAFNEAVEKLKVDQTYLEASTVRELIGRAKYNNGLLSFEDWDIIENDLITRQTTVLSSRQNRVLAEAAWEQAQGKGVVP